MGVDDLAIAALAARQAGVFSRRQALDLGATPRQVRSRTATGRWVSEATGVLGFPGPASWQRRLWVALLHAGPTGVVGFQAAGQLHGLSPIGVDQTTLIVDRPRRHAPDGVTWHRVEDVAPHHLTVVRGMPVTTAARTVVDLAAVLRKGRFEQVVEDGIVRRTFTVAQVGDVLREVRRKGKPGVLLVEGTLDLLGPGEGLTRSVLERLLDEAIALAGLPDPLREHPIPTVQQLVGFADRTYEDARWIIEAGRKWHERRRQMARDAERDVEAARRGYLTTRLMWEHLSSDPRGSARALADIYAQRIAVAPPNPASRDAR